MFLSAVSVLVVAQSSSEIPEGLMNNPVLVIITQMTLCESLTRAYIVYLKLTFFLLQVNQSSLHLQRIYYLSLIGKGIP